MKFDELKISSDKELIAIFSNKKSGYYFTQTKKLNSDFWRGWFVGDDKILEDYALISDGKIIDKSLTDSLTLPYKIIKKNQNIEIEEILADYTDCLTIKIKGGNDNIIR